MRIVTRFATLMALATLSTMKLFPKAPTLKESLAKLSRLALIDISSALVFSNKGNALETLAG